MATTSKRRKIPAKGSTSIRILARQLDVDISGFLSKDPKVPGWFRVVLTSKENTVTRKGAARVLRAGRRIAKSPELQAALETVAGLGDAVAVARFLVLHASEEKTDAEVAAEREEARARLVARRSAHAREKLAEHQAALVREERLVARWQAKVAYYEKRGA